MHFSMQELEMTKMKNFAFDTKLKKIISGELTCLFKKSGVCQLPSCNKCDRYHQDVMRGQRKAKLRNITIQRLREKYGSK